MPLWVKEEDVQNLLTMEMAISAVEESMRQLGRAEATNHPRRRHHVPGGILHVMDAALPCLGVMGLKSYTTFRDGTNKFHVMVYSTETAELESVIEADWLGRMRTGAATAVAAKYLARPESETVGLVGAGRQASTQLEGVCSVLPIKEAFVYCRTTEVLDSFCAEHLEKLGIKVTPAYSLDDAVDGKDVIITATTTKDPFLHATKIKQGCHITAMGANYMHRREIFEDVVDAADIVVVDDLSQAMEESGELHVAVESGVVTWEEIVELGSVVIGDVRRESPEQITLFKSHGIAVWDMAVAAKVIEVIRST